MAACSIERGRGEGGDRRGGVGGIGTQGTSVATRAFERGRDKGCDRKGGVGAIGAQGTKVAVPAMERGRGEGGDREREMDREKERLKE